MKRAALYARYSTDLQRDRSIEDQFAVCRAVAQHHDLVVVASYEDRAVSGASIKGRPGIQAMMAAAKAGQFDAVIAESMSRIGRDQEDRASIRKRLKAARIAMITHSDGVVTPLIDGIRAVIDEMYLEDLKGMIRRGLQGVIADGRHAGGAPYGYRSVPGKPGELEIVAEEADVVRSIFAAYVAGRTPRQIACELSANVIPPQRGAHWNASTIHGTAGRGSGILQNALYVGRVVWNRGRMERDPDTNKRLNRPNPPGEWHYGECPHLAIVDEATWNVAQAIRQARSRAGAARSRAPRHLLSGLLRCACCGGGMSVKDRAAGRIRIVCTRAKEAKACENSRHVYLDTIEAMVLGGLKEKLTDRAAIELYVTSYNDERRRLAASEGQNRSRLEARLGSRRGELDRAIRNLIKGVLLEEEAGAHLAQLRRECAELEHELAKAAPPHVITLHPGAIRHYLEAIDRLAANVDRLAAEGLDEPQRALRDLVTAVTVHPATAATGLAIELQGRLAELTDAAIFPAGVIGGNACSAGPLQSIPPDGLAFRFRVQAA